MKTCLVVLFFATLAFNAVNAAPKEAKQQNVSNVTSTPDMAEALAGLLTAFQRIMPCGDENLNISIMAPVRIPKTQLNIEEKLLTLKGDIKDIVITGINEFIIIGLASNSSSNRTTFDILYKDLQILGDFDIYVEADLAGFKFIQTLKSLMSLQLLNVRVTGGLTIGTNQNGGMLFSDIDFYVQVGDIISNNVNNEWSVAVNNFVNRYISESSLLFLQTNRDFLNEMISGFITPIANDAFKNISSSEYIQAMLDSIQMYDAIDCSL